MICRGKGENKEYGDKVTQIVKGGELQNIKREWFEVYENKMPYLPVPDMPKHMLRP